LSLEELTGMFHDAGLRDLRTDYFKLAMALESFAGRVVPQPR
jgi:hypothetical protein